MESRSFSLLVSTVGQRPQPYTFDQDRVVIGRGEDCDLRIEHAGMSRTQLLLERGTGSQGEARFRITPFESTNPTLVNERPAVEGTIVPGDVIAVTEIRIALERATESARRKAGGKREVKQPMAPLRMVLLAATTIMALWVGYMFLSEGDDLSDPTLAAQSKLFLPATGQRCGNPVECATRARDAYTKGKAYYGNANADPGNLYRSAIEFERCQQFQSQLDRPLDDLRDLEQYAKQSKQRAQVEFDDAKFRFQRAMARNDRRSARLEADLLARMVPDDKHPYRIKLDAYRRALPKDEDK